MQLLARVVLDHLVDTDNPDGIHKPVEIHGNCPPLPGDRVFWPLHRKGHPPVGTDDLNPAPLDLEHLDADIHQCLQFGKKAPVIPACLVCSPGTIERDHLPGTHREVLPVTEEELVLKLGIFVRDRRELVRTALVAGDPLAGTTIPRHLVVVIGGPELGCQFKRQEVEVPVGGKVRVIPVEFSILLHEVRFDADLRFGETERLAPVIALEHHLHHRLEEEPHFPFELPVGPERGSAPVPDLTLVNAGLVLPERGDAGGELDGGEHQLPAPRNHHLGHLVDKHLHRAAGSLRRASPRKKGR